MLYSRKLLRTLGFTIEIDVIEEKRVSTFGDAKRCMCVHIFDNKLFVLHEEKYDKESFLSFFDFGNQENFTC